MRTAFLARREKIHSGNCLNVGQIYGKNPAAATFYGGLCHARLTVWQKTGGGTRFVNGWSDEMNQNTAKYKTMKNGKIGVTTENIFPVIKKFLYSDHEIFLRELISNAVDATQKLKTLSSIGEMKGELGDLTIRVAVDKEAKTLTVTDRGIGMTAEEVDKYINQIAFSGAEEFMEKYKNQAIIGHFGLGFYSSFMVADKVEIITKSYKEEAKTVHWSCTGTPEFEMEETDAEHDRGTTIVLHLSEDALEYAEEFEGRGAAAQILPVPARAHRLRQGQGVEGRQVRRYRQGQHHQQHRSAVDAQAGRHHRGAVQGVLPRALPDERRAAVLDPPEHRLSVPPDGHPLFPEDPQQLRDSEEQDPALFEPGLRDGSGRGHRAGIPDAAARRDRLARHSAQRVAELPAERLQREEDFELHHPQGRRPAAGAVQHHARRITRRSGTT